jgi:RNase P subunit RPR2
MEKIEVKELIITCEACGNVKKFSVNDEKDCERIFREFACQNNCGRNLYSFITVGTLRRY